MNFVLSTISATTATLYLVAMFKLAYPAARSYMIVLCALVSGVGMSFVVAARAGHGDHAAVGGRLLPGGVGAAAAAAGVRSADNKADEKREASAASGGER